MEVPGDEIQGFAPGSSAWSNMNAGEAQPPRIAKIENAMAQAFRAEIRSCMAFPFSGSVPRLR
jgi:hypothetical protein